jgi:hypothetical protein
MPFIKRDAQGLIVETREAPSEDALEYLEAGDPEVLRYWERTGGATEIRQKLATQDLEMARVVEDLIEVLIAKKVIAASDLPEAVGIKLDRRRSLRRAMSALRNLIVEE